MIDSDLPIMVVDDTRFSSAYMVNALHQAGYTNVVNHVTGLEALDGLRSEPVNVLLVDWMMPGMDGLELCSQVREIDKETGHFTYLILITGKDNPEALMEAFSRGVDDFIDKNHLNVELLPRVFAAGRISDQQNRLLSQQSATGSQGSTNTKGIAVVDAEFRVGNYEYGLLRLQDALQQCQGRGGQVWLMLMGITNLAAMTEQYGDQIHDEIAEEMMRRTRHLVRPLDFIVRTVNDIFAVIAYVEIEDREITNAFKRVHESLNHKEIKTGAGFLDVSIGTTLVIVEQKHAQLNIEHLFAYAVERLGHSTGAFDKSNWHPDTGNEDDSND